MRIFNALAITAATAGLSLSAFAFEPEPGNYALDSGHVHIGFAVDHLGYSRVVGRFNEVSGEISVPAAGDSTVSVEIKSASVDTNHGKRDEHLRSPDFFNAKQFPTITFSGPLSVSGLNEGAVVTGELTLLGRTRPVELTLHKGHEGKDPWGLYRIGYTAEATVKRSDFGMDFMQGGIGDEVTLVIELEAVKQ